MKVYHNFEAYQCYTPAHWQVLTDILCRTFTISPLKPVSKVLPIPTSLPLILESTTLLYRRHAEGIHTMGRYWDAGVATK